MQEHVIGTDKPSAVAKYMAACLLNGIWFYTHPQKLPFTHSVGSIKWQIYKTQYFIHYRIQSEIRLLQSAVVNKYEETKSLSDLRLTTMNIIAYNGFLCFNDLINLKFHILIQIQQTYRSIQPKVGTMSTAMTKHGYFYNQQYDISYSINSRIHEEGEIGILFRPK